MKNSIIFSLATLLLLGAACSPSEPQSSDDTGLKPVEEFSTIRNEEDRSRALYSEVYKVLSHPRCLNCHTADDSPRQGEQMTLHEPPVVRGDVGFGAIGMNCTTCHGSENYAYATGEGSIPGHEIWFMPPLEMAWLGKSPTEVCEQIKDTERNGGRSLDDIIEHNTHDGLVGWAWNPGDGREPAPGTQALFGELTKAWIETGAHCPQE